MRISFILALAFLILAIVFNGAVSMPILFMIGAVISSTINCIKSRKLGNAQFLIGAIFVLVNFLLFFFFFFSRVAGLGTWE